MLIYVIDDEPFALKASEQVVKRAVPDAVRQSRQKEL